MPLVRSDGLPTQHMRALAYWSAAPELDDVISLQVCGNEWVAHVTCRRQLIDELGAANGNGNGSAKGGGPPTHDVFHGMVAREKRIDHLEQGRGAADRRPRRVARARDRGRPRARRGAPRPSRRPNGSRPRSRSATSSCSRPPSGSTSSRRSCCGRRRAASAGTWRAPRRTAAPRALAGERAGRGPRLPLRGRPVGALPPPPAQRGREPRRGAAGPLPLPLRPLVPRGASARPRSSGWCRRCSTRACAGSGWRGRDEDAAGRQPRLLHLQRLPPAGGGLGRGAGRGQQRRRLLAGALALGLRRDRALAGAGAAGTLARLRRLPRHPPLQRDPRARHLPRPPGDRQPARGRRQHARRWRCTAASATSATPTAASSRASRRTSRSSATTRWRSPARSGPKAT